MPSIPARSSHLPFNNRRETDHFSYKNPGLCSQLAGRIRKHRFIASGAARLFLIGNLPLVTAYGIRYMEGGAGDSGSQDEEWRLTAPRLYPWKTAAISCRAGEGGETIAATPFLLTGNGYRYRIRVQQALPAIAGRTVGKDPAATG
jgi:hypothetical protein